MFPNSPLLLVLMFVNGAVSEEIPYHPTQSTIPLACEGPGGDTYPMCYYWLHNNECGLNELIKRLCPKGCGLCVKPTPPPYPPPAPRYPPAAPAPRYPPNAGSASGQNQHKPVLREAIEEASIQITVPAKTVNVSSNDAFGNEFSINVQRNTAVQLSTLQPTLPTIVSSKVPDATGTSGQQIVSSTQSPISSQTPNSASDTSPTVSTVIQTASSTQGTSTTQSSTIPTVTTIRASSSTVIATRQIPTVAKSEKPKKVDAKWESWSNWGRCTIGRQYRTRSCESEEPKACTGSDFAFRLCNAFK